MKHGSLFSGIGGFDLASEWMRWENIFHCEINPFGRKVLKYYWPNAISYEDITKTDFTIHRGTIDILTGGFPCQPYSVAGKRKGKEDARHLWPEMLRAIQEIQPRYIVGENVPGIINWNRGLVFNEVQTDLENEGYEVQPIIIPACAVNAQHRRDRIWFIAYNNSKRCKSSCGLYSELYKQKKKNEFNGFYRNYNGWENFPITKPTICKRIYGLPTKLDGITFSKWRNESIKAYGNAVVPQVVYEIFKVIQIIDNKKNQ
jgi:DNA (cytosine-5)-methyltransferase 1